MVSRICLGEMFALRSVYTLSWDPITQMKIPRIKYRWKIEIVSNEMLYRIVEYISDNYRVPLLGIDAKYFNRYSH